MECGMRSLLIGMVIKQIKRKLNKLYKLRSDLVFTLNVLIDAYMDVGN